jgi:hypothetical protein
MDIPGRFKAPWSKGKDGTVRFYFDPVSNKHPRSRYRLTYHPKTREFTLRKFVKFRHGKEIGRGITDERVQDFRAALLPEQLADIIRLSITPDA